MIFSNVVIGHQIGKIKSFKEWHKCQVEKPTLHMVWEMDLSGLDTCLTFWILCVLLIRAINSPGAQIFKDNFMFPIPPTSLGCQWSWEIAAKWLLASCFVVYFWLLDNVVNSMENVHLFLSSPKKSDIKNEKLDMGEQNWKDYS